MKEIAQGREDTSAEEEFALSVPGEMFMRDTQKITIISFCVPMLYRELTCLYLKTVSLLATKLHIF